MFSRTRARRRCSNPIPVHLLHHLACFLISSRPLSRLPWQPDGLSHHSLTSWSHGFSNLTNIQPAVHHRRLQKATSRLSKLYQHQLLSYSSTHDARPAKRTWLTRILLRYRPLVSNHLVLDQDINFGSPTFPSCCEQTSTGAMLQSKESPRHARRHRYQACRVPLSRG